MSVSIGIDNVVKKYGDTTIIPDLSAFIKNGEFFTLLGPSGCGKTTLLRMIAGFNSIEGGTIKFDDKVINDIPAQKRNIGMVFQSYASFPHLTVRQNVEYGLKIRKVPKEHMKERVDEILKVVKIDEYQDRLPERLSGGQQQRVALARALAAEPRVLLLDEPFSGLDEGLRTEMARLVRKLHEAWKITTILVTHDKAEALRLSDRIALMEDGKILQYGTPEQMFCHPETKKVAEYFGKVNYISGSVAGGRFVSPLFEKRTDLPDGVYDAMIRPNSVQLKEEGDYTVEEVTFMGEMTEIRVRVPEKMAPGGSILCQRMEGPGWPVKLRAGMKAGLAVETEGAVLFRHDME